MNKNDIIISVNLDQAVEKLLDYIYNELESKFKHKPIITIGLSGAGMVPLLTNELLKQKERFLPYKNKLVFLACDERFVPLEHSDSTLGEYIQRGLFKGLEIPDEHVLTITNTNTVEECAIDYEKRLKLFLNENNAFDILLLGCGPDGHTCSLFPGHELFTNSSNIKEIVVSISNSPKPPPERVTLSLNYINNSSYLLFLCGGESKAEIFKRILIDQDLELPSTNVKPNLESGVLKWFIDHESAKLF